MRHFCFVANYRSDTGYAWSTIERVFGLLAARLQPLGVACEIAYPRLLGRPESLAGLPVDVLEGPFGEEGARGSLRKELAFIRDRRIDLLYLTDRPTRSVRYLAYRAGGVRHIVVHDRTSGTRTPRRGITRLAKVATHRIPGYSADRFIGVSEFVRRRLIEVNGTPPARTYRVYNGVDLGRFEHPVGPGVHEALALPRETKVVFTAARANPYKGIPILLEAASILETQGSALHFAYAGEGPSLDAFKRRATELGLRRFHFLGKRSEVPALLASATIAVVPSVWAEAFGLTVVEAMAAGTPLVASAIGGIPELVREAETGLLVPPGDPVALAGAIGRLADDPDLRGRLARHAKRDAYARFGVDRVADELAGLLRPLLTQPSPA